MKNHYRFWIVLSFLVVFAAGLFSGVMLDRYALNRPITPDRESREKSRRPRPRFPTVESLAEELTLSEEQREDLSGVFSESEQRLHTMHAEVRDKYRALRNRFLEEIKSILNEEQIQRFDAMLERFASRHRTDIENRRKQSKTERKNKGAQE